MSEEKPAADSHAETTVGRADESAYAPQKSRIGAPLGNTNALKHGATAKRARRLQRDSHRRAAERESRSILRGMGLDAHPLARRLAMRLTDVETEIARLATYLEGKGRFDNRGNLRPAYARYLDLQHQDRGEIRHLLDRLAELRGDDQALSEEDAKQKIMALAKRWPAALAFRVCLADGEDITDAIMGRGAPLQADRLAALPSAFDGSLALPEAASAPQSTLPRKAELLQAHPGDVREPRAEPLPVPPKTIEAETELQRRWRLGLDID